MWFCQQTSFQIDLFTYAHTQRKGVGIDGVLTAFNLLEITNLIYINGEKNPEISA